MLYNELYRGRLLWNRTRKAHRAGPVGDKALEEIIFRASHGVLQSLAPYPGPQRVAMLPSVVRMLLATFLEEVAGRDCREPR
jgi:hypothetical protein